MRKNSIITVVVCCLLSIMGSHAAGIQWQPIDDNDTIVVNEDELVELLKRKAIEVYRMRSQGQTGHQQSLTYPQSATNSLDARFDRLEQMLAHALSGTSQPIYVGAQNPRLSMPLQQPYMPVQPFQDANRRDVERLQKQIDVLEKQIEILTSMVQDKEKVQQIQQQSMLRDTLRVHEPVQVRTEYVVDTVYQKPDTLVKTIVRTAPVTPLSFKRQVFFGVSSALLTAEATMVLRDIAAMLTKKPQQKIALTGFSSQDGNEQQNCELAKKRMQTVQTYLLKKGVNSDQIIRKTYEIDYVSDMKTYARRVDISTIE